MDDESTAYRKALDTTTRSPGDGFERRDLPVPALTILSHPDTRRIGERVCLSALAAGKDVFLSRLEPVFGGRRALADPFVSRHPVRFTSLPGGTIRLSTSDTATRVEADGVEVAPYRDFSAAQLQRGVVLLLADRIVLLLHELPPFLPEDPRCTGEMPSFGLLGESAAMAALRCEIRRVADLDVPVLLRGETGTGKELVAAAVHQASARCRRPFVAVNMGALPASLAAAELFGAARGAFTGAERHRGGYFTRARGGTLFLDEIGEAPPEVQVLLLRVLETGLVQPVGSETSQEADVRILAATDADLESGIASGSFRAPLLHRLRGYEIRLPPLAERLDDLGRLLYHFLRLELEPLGEAWRLESPPKDKDYGTVEPWLPARVVARLARYAWPGNVRELRNAARQLVIGNRGAPRLAIPPMLEELLGAEPPAPETEAPSTSAEPGYRAPSEVGEEEVLRALEAHGFRLQPAAAALGISRASLYNLIERSSRIRKAGDLTRGEIERSIKSRGGDLDAMAEQLKVSRKGLRRRMTQLGFS